MFAWCSIVRNSYSISEGCSFQFSVCFSFCCSELHDLHKRFGYSFIADTLSDWANLQGKTKKHPHVVAVIYNIQ